MNQAILAWSFESNSIFTYLQLHSCQLLPLKQLGVHLSHLQLVVISDLTPEGHQLLHLLDSHCPGEGKAEALLTEGQAIPGQETLEARPQSQVV